MDFANLPPQPPLFPAEADDYARQTLARSAEAARLCHRIADVRYGSDYWQSLDVYPAVDAAGGGAPAPVLVFAHGGAWTNGYKEWMGLMAPPLVSRGIVFVSLSYRLAPEHRWQAMLDDCLAGLGWVHRNIAAHGGDPMRIAVGGHSAGGHLMTLAALQPRRLREHGIPLDAITACFPLCAPLDIRYPDRQPGSGEDRTHRVLLADESEAAAASPVCHVHRGMPYTLLAHAAGDLPRIVRSNEGMARALREIGVAHDSIVVDGDHFSAALDVGSDHSAWVRRVADRLSGQ